MNQTTPTQTQLRFAEQPTRNATGFAQSTERQFCSEISSLTLVACLSFWCSSVCAQQPLWDDAAPVPAAADLDSVDGVEFHVIKRWEPKVDGFNWLHGIALAWHNDRLYASFGHNAGKENTATEVANYCVSDDKGVTWSKPALIDDGQEDNLAVSHGVLLNHKGRLWAFQGAFFGRMRDVHTRAYVLNDKTDVWEKKGTVIADGFWPMQEPQRMENGNWIMAGLKVTDGYGGPNDPAAVAISHGDNLLKWDLVPIPKPPDLEMWGESTVILDGANALNIARYRSPVALVSYSSDFGRSWSMTASSNLPMTASKPSAGILSSGQRYLIANTVTNGRNQRWPLTIAVTAADGGSFQRIFRIRDAIHDGPGESHGKAALSYPYAVELNGKLYVGYSNAGGRGGNQNSGELAIIPVSSLASP